MFTIEKSKEIKFGKAPKRKKAKKGTAKGRRRRQSGNMSAQELADAKKRQAGAGSDRGYLGEDRNPDAVRYDDTDTTTTDRSNVSVRVKEIRAEAKEREEAKDRLKSESDDKELIDRRGKSREEKQNTSQGSGGGTKSNIDKISHATDPGAHTGAGLKNPTEKIKPKSPTSKLLDKLDSTKVPKKEPKKSNPYADAKKKDPKLDSHIKIRNNSKKGSPEHTRAQNAINAAYGKGPQRKVAPTKTVKAQEAGPIDRPKTKSSGLQTKKSAPAPKPKSTPKSKSGISSGIGLKSKSEALKKELKSSVPVQAAKSKIDKFREKRSEAKSDRRDRRNRIREAKGKSALPRKQAQFGLGAIKGAISGFKEGGIGGALKGGVKGSLGLGQGGIMSKAAGALGIGGGGGGGAATAQAPGGAAATPAVDPNAVPQAKKGKVIDRRKRKRKQMGSTPTRRSTPTRTNPLESRGDREIERRRREREGKEEKGARQKKNETPGGSSRKDLSGTFMERNEADRGSGSMTDINLLPEATVEFTPRNRRTERVERRHTRKEQKKTTKTSFKDALNSWKEGGKNGPRPRRRDFKP